MQRSKLPYIFLGLAAVIAAIAVVIFIANLRQSVADQPRVSAAAETQPAPKPIIPTLPKPPLDITAAPETSFSEPAALVAEIAAALTAGDLSKFEKLLGKVPLDPQNRARLEALSGSPSKLREMGEIELNTRSRWALEFAHLASGSNAIFLDLRRDQATWSVEKITLPALAGEAVGDVASDSLTVADGFLAAVLRQDFERARVLVDPAGVSDTKIAGLCILFEEGGYQLRKSKPLRAMFERQDTVGYLANVENPAANQVAEFALNLSKSAPAEGWRISEINLNQLLADYAQRVAGGDLYYSPLVKNPAGGETLALYFEFDEDQVGRRTQRQLEIVAAILRADPAKKITLSGHTDALGTKNYNNDLSSRRAAVVRDFLSRAGVTAGQIITSGKGDSQPRRPNLTEAGADNPDGRRANRRTEIYLDF